jgi:hypothetical protein
VIGYLFQNSVSAIYVVTLCKDIFGNHIRMISIHTPIIKDTIILTSVKQRVLVSLTNRFFRIVSCTFLYFRWNLFTVGVHKEFRTELLIVSFVFVNLRFGRLHHVPVFRVFRNISSIGCNEGCVFVLQIKDVIGQVKLKIVFIKTGE